MIRIGLTGNVASGKSAVAQVWKDAGVPVVSADQLARDVVRPGSDALRLIEEAFGEHVIQSDGDMDRVRVRELVFNDPQALTLLEGIVHPAIETLREAWVADQLQEGAAFVAMEIPLLFQVGLDKKLDVVVVVEAPSDVRLERIVDDRGLTEVQAQAIMDVQLSAADMRAGADYVIENTGSLRALENEALAVLERIRVLERVRGLERIPVVERLRREEKESF